MSQGAYPISKLIAKIVQDSGLRRSEFVHRIGYRNTAKGLRRLDEWLENGCGDGGFIERLKDSYGPADLEKALADTEAVHEREHQEAVRDIEERERRRFRSFVWVHTEDGAHSFFSALAERQNKVLSFQEGFERLPKAEQLIVAQRRVREHFEQTGGRYQGFGAIQQYRWADSFDTSKVLDISGNVINENGGQFLLPEVRMLLH